MTQGQDDAMRVAMAAVAISSGLSPDRAWGVVDSIDTDGKDPRAIVDEVYAAAADTLYPGLA